MPSARFKASNNGAPDQAPGNTHAPTRPRISLTTFGEIGTDPLWPFPSRPSWSTSMRRAERKLGCVATFGAADTGDDRCGRRVVPLVRKRVVSLVRKVVLR
jgi:hypothetical protein